MSQLRNGKMLKSFSALQVDNTKVLMPVKFNFNNFVSKSERMILNCFPNTNLLIENNEDTIGHFQHSFSTRVNKLIFYNFGRKTNTKKIPFSHVILV